MKLYERMVAYESVSDVRLCARLPVIVRADGNCFSRFTKVNHCTKPFDTRFSDAMVEAMRAVADRVEDCVFGVTHSDEMSFILRNDKSNESTPWFDNRVQKIVSIVSSCATATFNRVFFKGTEDYRPGLFDARAFIVSDLYEAANYVLYRQLDCVKNSISCMCDAELIKKLGKKEALKLMLNKTGKERQELLFNECGLNWNDVSTRFKRGVSCYVQPVKVNETMRNKWVSDFETPDLLVEKDWVLSKIQ